ncbi:MAG: ATP synthase F1 subunit delta [Deltaproteobacteria bacterium]|nr:ATP synthase F1 subunit delta [Deltaproteobacteria bacterium]
MRGSEIAKRYSKAFFAIAAEEARYEEYYNELTIFSSLLEQNDNLKGFFINPMFAQTDKAAVLNEVLKKIKVSPITANFLRLLVDKRRIGALQDIGACYQDLMDSVLGKVRVQVKSAYKLSDDMMAQIKATMEKITEKTVEMETERDASLLGGVVVKVGDTLYDGSVKTQLSNIRELLREEI